MSQQLGFILEYKNNPEIKVELSWFSTTPARRLSNEGIFPYTEEDKLLTEEMFKDYISRIDEELNNYKAHKDKCIKDEIKYDSLIIKATTEASVKALLSEKNELQTYIKDWQEEIDDWSYYKTIANLMLDYMLNNKDKWDMYYYNC